MPTSSENREPGSYPLRWFALSIAGGFFLSFFVYWVFAALLAVSLGAVATTFKQTRQGQRVSAWLALPAVGVFAFAAGSFLHGFSSPQDVDFRGRVVMGATELLLMIFAGGNLPLEGAARVAPWRHVAVAWVVLTGLVFLLSAWMRRHRHRL
ncbi:MAG TPA: hypothetical protein VK477_11490 [Acidobacteriota bacterium]|nr:hypothetical protein [Acidobacteriota bacterium]